MEAKGLMIGNYMHAHGGNDVTFCEKGMPRFLAKVCDIGEDGVYIWQPIEDMPNYYHKSIEYIDISGEMLMRLGFGKDELIDSYDIAIRKPGHGDNYIFRVMKVDNGWWFIVDENKGTERGGLNFGIYNYIHEVQNMYFMLSKEELELKKSIKN